MPFSTTGTPENLCAFIKPSASASVASGPIVIGSTTIPEFVFLYASHLGCLVLQGHVLMNDAESTSFGHGDGKATLGHRVHGRGDEWNAERDLARKSRSQIGIGGKHAGGGGHQQHVVEGQSFGNAHAISARGMARHHTHCPHLAKVLAGWR